MEVNSLKISKVFSSGGDVQYVLPHFQREYAWEKENWQTLLTDIFSIYEAYNSDSEPEHFLGALVVIKDGMRSGTIPAFKLVDGQQRLTTISLILCALGDLCQDKNPSLFKKIRKLLVNPDEEDILHFKLIPTTKYGDRDAYINIILHEPEVQNTGSKIIESYDYIQKELNSRINRDNLDLEKIFLVIANCMQVVFIDLDQRERPYEIFESLNNKGKRLTQPDLIRNYIAMKLPEAKQEIAFQKYWSIIEDTLRENRTVSRIGELTAFLRHYLAHRSGILFNKDHIYARFRDRIEKEFNTIDSFFGELDTLKRFAGYYDRLVRPEKENDIEIRESLFRLNILELSTAYPFLLAAYEAMNSGTLTKEAFVQGLQVLENYMMRRYLAGEPTNYLNKMFPTLWREVDITNFTTSLQQALISKNYPSDNRIHQSLLTLHIYDRRSQNKVYLVLDTINRFLSAGSGAHTVLDDSPSIEHILPQSPDAMWKNELGENWEETYREYLHTIGNLTIVTQEWNSSLSNGSFSAKKQRFSQHGLLLNSIYFNQAIPQWDKKSIQERTNWLTEKILEIWPSFGDTTLSPSDIGQKPHSLIIGGDSHYVNSWRDVAFVTAEYIANFVDNFDQIAEDMPTFFSTESRPRSRQMSNGWWIYLNLSSNSVKNLCRRLISAAELSDEDWQLVFD